MTRPWTGPILRRLGGLLAVALLAVFWSSVWSDLDRSVLSRVPVLDEAIYLTQAAEMADGRLLPDEPFFMSSLYPYLVAATGSGRELSPEGVRLGAPPHVLRLVQALMWLGTAVLLWRTARRFAPPGIAWLAPASWMLYAPAAVFASAVLLEVPLALAATAALFVATGGPASTRRAVAAGVLVGAATLLRTSGGLLIVPVVLALVGSDRRAWRRGVPALLAAVLTVLPAVAFNSLETGRLVGPSLNGGVNLYIGNGPEAEGFYVSYRGVDVRRDLTGRAFLGERMGQEVPDAAAADAAWARAGRRAVLDDPLRALGLWLRKLRLHLVAAEIPQISPLSAWRREVPILRALPVPYGLLSAAGLLGLLLVGLREPRLRPWALAALLLIAGQSLFFVVSRYRLVLVPLWALLGTAAVGTLWAERGRRLAAGLGLGAACALAVAPWGLGSVLERLEAAGRANEAVRWERLGVPAEALSRYEASLALIPDHPRPRRAAARIHAAAGRIDESERLLRRGLEIAVPPDDLRRDLINLLLEAGRPGETLDLLREHVRARPDDHEMMHNYAVALAGAGRADEAEFVAGQLVMVAPDDPRGYIDLGVILARQGRLEEARTVFRQGLERVPGDPRLQANLERVEARLPE